MVLPQLKLLQILNDEDYIISKKSSVHKLFFNFDLHCIYIRYYYYNF